MSNIERVSEPGDIDIEHVAELLTVDFTATVKAIKKARAAKVDGITSAMEEAEAERTEGLAEVRRLQEEAARMAAESLRMAEKKAKADRTRKKHIGITRSKNPMPFGRGSRLKRKIGGGVVLRQMEDADS